MSTAQWPANKYIPPGCQNISIMQGYWRSREDCFDWYRENTMIVEVYFERSSIQIMTETKAYTPLQFLGNAGGQLGLWLGMSAVSVLEILIFFVILIVYAIIRPASAKNMNRAGSQHFDYWDSMEKDYVLEEAPKIAGQ
ncbi:CRE-DEL-4 protein, partial [Aphelenchoides avenae]